MKKIGIIFCVLLLMGVALPFHSFAQVKVGDNPTSINGNALLELESTNKGLLVPRIALTSAADASPLTSHVEGMFVYNTSTAGSGVNAVTPGYYFNNGTKWIKIQESNEAFQYTKLVYLNKDDPNDPTPPTLEFYEYPYKPGGTNINIPGLAMNSNYLYIGATDFSAWVWDGTIYVTYVVPNSTEWYIDGTIVDAGNNKNGTIWRPGRVSIGTMPSNFAALTAVRTAFALPDSSSTTYMATGANIGTWTQITSDGTYIEGGSQFSAVPKINSGVTNSGYSQGVNITVARNRAGDNGTLANQNALIITYGHGAYEPVTNTPTTTKAAGVYVRRFRTTPGTITTAYDFYAEEVGTTTSVTNNYGFYILGNKINYVQGRFGIKQSNPQTNFAVYGLPVYADNAAAIAAGLGLGDFYRTATGQVMVRY